MRSLHAMRGDLSHAADAIHALFQGDGGALALEGATLLATALIAWLPERLPTAADEDVDEAT